MNREPQSLCGGPMHALREGLTDGVVAGAYRVESGEEPLAAEEEEAPRVARADATGEREEAEGGDSKGGSAAGALAEASELRKRKLRVAVDQGVLSQEQYEKMLAMLDGADRAGAAGGQVGSSTEEEPTSVAPGDNQDRIPVTHAHRLISGKFHALHSVFRLLMNGVISGAGV